MARRAPTKRAAPVLGRAAAIPDSPERARLDTVPAPNRDSPYVVRLTAPEFTSLCPITGQPDFAHLVIDYVPKDLIVESKSLKLYLTSFRNHGAFHEACSTDIARRLVKELSPRWLRLAAFWYPRGGIPIDVFFQTGPGPKGLYVPDPGVSPYRGRG